MVKKMLSKLLRGIYDLSVVNRGLFFLRHIPSVLPEFSKKLFLFATKGNEDSVAADVNEECFVALSANLSSLFNLDEEEKLWKELHSSSLKDGKNGLGVVLVSKKDSCQSCNKKLSVKASRICNVVVYHESRGTFLGCRIGKVCSNRACNVTQHYGFYTVGEDKYYDEDWSEHEYLLSSGKTAFDMKLLSKFEVEILLGKLSFKEKADIFNEVNGYSDEGTKCGDIKPKGKGSR